MIQQERKDKVVRHFILTRFNLLLWNKDKKGHKVRTIKWLEHRFSLFEKFCFPSIKNQTCQKYEWIVLFDSTTPKRFKERVEEFQKTCPQLIPVYVRPNGGLYFAQIFRDEVVKRLNDNENNVRVLTTYFDNDDSLDIHFVEDLQRRAQSLPDRTFITYDNGYQLFTDHNYVMCIRYPRNHFISVVECGNKAKVKTIYGYGSHYYIDKIEGARIEHVKNSPMWCEVIHEKNMGNDAYFLRARMMEYSDLLRRNFALDISAQSGTGLYLFQFIPRYIKTFIKRVRFFFFGRHW